MTTEQTGPRDVLRDGNLKASIWEGASPTGPSYSTSLSRTYKDKNGEYRDSHNFAGTELLRVSELAKKAYDRMGDLRREDRAAARPEQAKEARRAAFQEQRSPSETSARSPERPRG